MSRTTAFAATAISALLAAGPALAWGKKPAPAPAAAAAATTAPSSAATAQAPAAAPAKAPPPAPVKATPEQRAQADRLDPLSRSAFWSNQFQLDQHDVEAGVHLAAALRALGQNAEAAQTAQQVLIVDPNNRDALMETARAFVAEGQGFYAIDPLTKAKALDARDWRIMSLLGVAYGQVSRDADAIDAFRQALALSPNNPAVLSNQAMQMAAHGDMPGAETVLRQAAADPRATAQERQNLALVLGLQGKFAEAEQLARRDLPPELAENNIAYWKAAAGSGSDARSWNALKGAQTAVNPGGV
jgi:Flp pilus assembly protein TadD